MKGALLLLALAGVAGCGGQTGYVPKVVAHSELTMRYDDGLEIWTGRRMLARAPGFEGLAHHVRCVPRAREHAEQAESDGATAIGTGWAGGVLGVLGLGGLAGLAFLEEDEVKAYAILGSGVAVGLIGVVLAGFSRNLKNSANGHAVDALNYYNDAVGSLGGSCDHRQRRRSKPPPPALVPRKPAEVPAPPPAEPPVEPPVEEPNQTEPAQPPEPQ
jgi:hypothetical protein